MTVGFIDSASLHQVVAAFDNQRFDDCHPWAWRTLVETTSVLITDKELRVAPSPVPAGTAKAGLGRIMDGLAGIVGVVEVDSGVASDAQAATRRWARRTPRLAAAYADLWLEEASFPDWLEWSIREAWVEHASRLGGLFEYSYLNAIGSIVAEDPNELEELWYVSSDARRVAAIAKERPESELRTRLSRAYVASTLIRGRYHDTVASKSGLHIVHHPLREGIFDRSPSARRQDVHLSAPTIYLAHIVVAAAFAQRRGDREGSWLDSLRELRRANDRERLDLRDKLAESAAIDAAVAAAREANIRVHRVLWDQILEYSIVVAGTFAGLFVEPWTAASIALGSEAGVAVAKHYVGDPARRVIESATRRPARLEALAQAEPGRVRRQWAVATTN